MVTVSPGTGVLHHSSFVLVIPQVPEKISLMFQPSSLVTRGFTIKQTGAKSKHVCAQKRKRPTSGPEVASTAARGKRQERMETL